MRRRLAAHARERSAPQSLVIKAKDLHGRFHALQQDRTEVDEARVRRRAIGAYRFDTRHDLTTRGAIGDTRHTIGRDALGNRRRPL